MAQADKSALWKELKDAGVQFPLHYREYSTEQLQAAVDRLHELRAEQAAKEPAHEPPPIIFPDELPPAQVGGPEPMTQPDLSVAGITLNTHAENEPVEVEPSGRVWFQKEVRKPAFAQPRGRRVLDYTDTGVKTVTANTGDYVESFEMPGDGQPRRMQAKITLPSYQVGIYRDPGMPFRVHIYDNKQGFDFFEVNDFYGGPELVPTDIKRIYVSSTLCYDIRTTVRAIQAEARERGLLNGM